MKEKRHKYKWDFYREPGDPFPGSPFQLYPVNYKRPRDYDPVWDTIFLNNKNELFKWYKDGILTGKAEKWIENELIKIGRSDLLNKKNKEK